MASFGALNVADPGCCDSVRGRLQARRDHGQATRFDVGEY